jgi:hypothetical protein
MAVGPVREVESKQMTPGTDVTIFPTFIVEDEDGLEVKRVEGRQTNPKALMRQLGMKSKKMGTTRRSSRRNRPRTTRRNIR